MMTKQQVREKVYVLRKSMSEDEVHKKSECIVEKILALPVYRKAERIFAYIDFRNEVSMRELIRCAWEDGKQVAVPKCRNGEMDFIEIRAFSQLEKGSFGLLEPGGGDAVLWEDALMIMPGVAFDYQLNRIGYGGGYYDRYLSRHPQLLRIAPAFQFQLFPRIPSEPFDARPQILITEEKTLYLSLK